MLTDVALVDDGFYCPDVENIDVHEFRRFYMWQLGFKAIDVAPKSVNSPLNYFISTFSKTNKRHFKSAKLHIPYIYAHLAIPAVVQPKDL